MASINVDKLSLKDLQDLEGRVSKAIVVARDRERSEAKQKVAALAGDLGFSVGELFSSGRGRGTAGKSGIKYRNPKNPSETWTGRGRKPNWLVEQLENGVDIEDFAI